MSGAALACIPCSWALPWAQRLRLRGSWPHRWVVSGGPCVWSGDAPRGMGRGRGLVPAPGGTSAATHWLCEHGQQPCPFSLGLLLHQMGCGCLRGGGRAPEIRATCSHRALHLAAETRLNLLGRALGKAEVCALFARKAPLLPTTSSERVLDSLQTHRGSTSAAPQPPVPQGQVPAHLLCVGTPPPPPVQLRGVPAPPHSALPCSAAPRNGCWAPSQGQ